MRFWSSPVIGLAVLCFLCVGCTPGIGQPAAKSSPFDSQCALSTLQADPHSSDPYGSLPLGPLWIPFGRMSPGSPAMLAEGAGSYDGWKVVIHPDASATGTVNLSGVQCSSGKQVRFCYEGCDWDSRLKASVVTLTVYVGRHLDYTGYMVFPGPGLTRLGATDSHGLIGTVVIEVPQISD
jgi:hypothetical protein